MSPEAGSSELHAALVDALGADVVSGRLAAGHVLTLDGLGAQYEVSRSVAREAIRPLSKTVVALAEATESRRGLGRERGPARATVPAFGQLAAVL